METLDYLKMTYNEIAELDRDKTVFFSSISPVETHGTHLPMGNDIFIAENLRDRVISKMREKRPDLIPVILPTISIGTEAIPVAGSFRVRYRAVLFSLLDMGSALADMGFKYWLLTDNHGGPRHQLAIELASRRLRKKNFALVAPFNEAFRRMVAKDPDLLEKTGLPPDAVGGSDDAHAGTNETSLSRAIFPELVRDSWKTLGPGKVSPSTFLSKLLETLEKISRAMGNKTAETDFYFLAHGLAWVSDPHMDPYQGDPSKSTPEAGEKMMEYRASLATELLEEALAGNQRYIKPLGWTLRALRDVL